MVCPCPCIMFLPAFLSGSAHLKASLLERFHVGIHFFRLGLAPGSTDFDTMLISVFAFEVQIVVTRVICKLIHTSHKVLAGVRREVPAELPQGRRLLLPAELDADEASPGRRGR